MNRLIHICFLLLISPFFSYSQICKGRVLDAQTGEPVVYANVFLQGSMIGTTTNSNGEFELDLKENKSLPLMVSCIGYNSVKIDPVQLKSSLEVLLHAKSHELEDITINSEPCIWSRKKMLNIFKNDFIGTTRIAKACEIVNPDQIYLYYNHKTHILHATSQEPIIIRNSMLGYMVYFDIDYFEWHTDWTKYRGAILFEEFVFSNSRERDKVKNRRRNAFKGTPMHFIRSLYSECTEENGFLFYTKDGESVSSEDLFVETNGERYLLSKEPLVVKYRAEHARTTLHLHNDRLKLYEVGYFDPEEVLFTGFLGTFRVGDMLPYDYQQN